MRQKLGGWLGGQSTSKLLRLCIMAESTEIEMVCLRSNLLADRWKSHFERYDEQRKGEIKMADFLRILEEPEFQEEVDPHKMEIFRLKTSENMMSTISYQEFINIMSGKRNPSFKQAVEQRETEGWRDDYVRTTGAGRQTLFQKMVRWVAKEYLTDDAERQYYADRYTCWPPPLFIPLISILEIGCFVYYCVESGDLTANGPVPVESLFIYRPDRRIEVWRFLFYIFIHAGWVHLFFNLLVQMLVGLPLEMIHGSVRVGTIYLAGVLAGSLGTSVFDMEALLVGASGGVYALLAAHLANVLLNFAEMELGVLKLAGVFIVASADVGFAIWDRYSSEDNTPPIGYTAHLMGALAGLTIGLVVLKNFEQRLHEQYMWWIALALYMGCTGFAIFWNIFYY